MSEVRPPDPTTPRTPRWAITGSTGLLGTKLTALLKARGHEVVPIVRGEARPGAIRWNPDRDEMPSSQLRSVDVIVHLAGESIAAGRWTEDRKLRILDSRVRTTRLLSRTLAALPEPRPRLVSASAIGYYGDRDDELLDEDSPAGDGFLAEVCRLWEASADAARTAGVTVACVRIGIVLDKEGGALAQMLLPFRLGLGGRFGSGMQYMSWITLADTVRAIHHVGTQGLEGPFNLVTPHAVRNREFVAELGRVLRRPAALPVPALALRAALGEMARELLIAGARAIPKRLLESGFEFEHPRLPDALRAVVAGT